MENIQKKVRRSLIEAKKQQENYLIESKIVKSRIKTILESTADYNNFSKLPFERQWQIGVPLMQEISYLKGIGVQDQLLQEQGIMQLLGKLFGTTVSSGGETIFEAMLSSLLKKMGFSGFIADAIVFFFSRNPGKIWESFSDCRALSKNLGQAIMEAYIKKLQIEYQYTGAGMDFIRNALMETLENSDFGSKLADQFANFICGFFGTVKEKGGQILSNINQTKPAPAN